MSEQLTTIERAKMELEIEDANTDQDTLLDRLISEISRAVNSYCGRTFGYQTGHVTESLVLVTEKVFLPLYPVAVVNSVTVGRATDPVPANLVRTRKAIGLVQPLRTWSYLGTTYGGAPEEDNYWHVAIDTDGGYVLPGTETPPAGIEALPLDIETACLMGISAAYHSKGRDPAIRQDSTVGVGSTMYNVVTASADMDAPMAFGRLPQEALHLLSGYKNAEEGIVEVT